MFGVNGFVHFIAIPPVNGLGIQFMEALYLSHYPAFIYFLELIGGLLLFLNLFVPLALVLPDPIVINIFFHALIASGDIFRVLVVACLWLAAIWAHRRYFESLFVMKVE